MVSLWNSKTSGLEEKFCSHIWSCQSIEELRKGISSALQLMHLQRLHKKWNLHTPQTTYNNQNYFFSYLSSSIWWSVKQRSWVSFATLLSSQSLIASRRALKYEHVSSLLSKTGVTQYPRRYIWVTTRERPCWFCEWFMFIGVHADSWEVPNCTVRISFTFVHKQSIALRHPLISPLVAI